MTYETELSQRLQNLQDQIAQVTQERDVLARYQKTYQNKIKLLESTVSRLHASIVLWHGKFLMLKQENNTLRRRCSKQHAESNWNIK